MNYEGNGCKVWRGYNDLIGLYGLELIMIQVRFVNIRESGFRNPRRGPGSLCLRDPDFQLWKPESKFHWQRIPNPAPGIWNPCRGIQNPRLPYMGLVRCYSRDHFAMADPGGGRGAPLIFRPNWGPKGRKKTFVTGPPPYLRVSLFAPPPPPLSYGLDPPLLCPPKRSQKASRLKLLMGQRTPQTTMVTEPYRLILIMFEKRSRKYMRPFIVVH